MSRRRYSLLRGTLSFSSILTCRVVARHISLSTVSVHSPCRVGIGGYHRAAFSELPIFRSGTSGVVNILRLGRFCGGLIRNGGIGVHRLLLPIACIRGAVPLPSILSGVHRGGYRLMIILSRCNNAVNVMALRSIVRRLINRV